MSKPNGYVGSVPAIHGCRLPRIFKVFTDNDEFTEGDVWECPVCHTRWIRVKGFWSNDSHWEKYYPTKHGQLV